jgi:hypothetical protein
LVLPFFPCFRLFLAWEHSMISRGNQYEYSFLALIFFIFGKTTK